MEVPASRRVIVFNKASILSMYVCTGQFSAHIHLNMKGNSLSQSLGKLFRSSVYKLLPSMNSLGNTVKYLEIKYMKDSPASLHLRGGADNFAWIPRKPTTVGFDATENSLDVHSRRAKIGISQAEID